MELGVLHNSMEVIKIAMRKRMNKTKLILIRLSKKMRRMMMTMTMLICSVYPWILKLLWPKLHKNRIYLLSNDNIYILPLMWGFGKGLDWHCRLELVGHYMALFGQLC